MRKSKRDLWRDLEALEGETEAIDVTTEFVEITEENPDPDVQVPDGARVLETESDVVTVWTEWME